jgi:hypothetical protein
VFFDALLAPLGCSESSYTATVGIVYVKDV